MMQIHFSSAENQVRFGYQLLFEESQAVIFHPGEEHGQVDPNSLWEGKQFLSFNCSRTERCVFEFCVDLPSLLAN